ncbi:hypothetical protein [Anaerococcus cruorum]|uniref:Uncharacterized protein n=1 Tax=Anaerococcus cruorum TaxID=3115617 RepID=A0ABW9MUF7_9FIRM
MKKVLKIAALALTFSFLGANPSFASSSAPILDLNVNMPNSTYIEDEVQLRQDEVLKNDFLEGVRRIRKEAWEGNFYFTYDGTWSPTSTIQTVAAQEGFTKEEYINNVYWNTEYEKIAIQRAYENLMEDTENGRPDNSSFVYAGTSKIDHPGMEFRYYSDGYSIATRQIFDIIRDMTIPYYKTIELKNELRLLIDPSKVEFGFAEVKPVGEEVYSYAIIAGEKTNLNQAVTNYYGNYTMFFGNKNYGNEKIEKLKASIKKAEQSIEGAKILMRTMPKFAKQRGKEINRLIQIQKDTIKKAQAILKNSGI